MINEGGGGQEWGEAGGGLIVKRRVIMGGMSRKIGGGKCSPKDESCGEGES